MSNKNLLETIKAQIKKDSTQYKVFNLLSDQRWHCRDCEGKQIGSGQYAGVEEFRAYNVVQGAAPV